MAALTLKYFMWGYQHYFQSSVQNAAESLFEELLPGVQPRAFLVGILNDDAKDRHPVCVEPDHENIEPEYFADVHKRAESAVADDERSRMIYSHPVAAERVHQRIIDDSYGRAIEACCRNAPGEEDSIFFASPPASVNGYTVFVVLRLSRSSLESQFRFQDVQVDRINVDQSFVEAVIAEFLACVHTAMHEPNAGANLNVVKASSEELLRRGGARFIKSVCWRVFGLDGLETVHGLCDSMTSISATRYEGDQAIGRFLLQRPESSRVRACVRFQTAVSLDETRRIRKLLELAKQEFALLVADKGVIGLARALKAPRKRKGTFEIEIAGHHRWRLLCGDNVLCEFHYGTPRLPRPKLSKDEFSELCDRIFDNSQVNELWKAVQACIAQRHGTILVISANAQKEAARLSQEATCVEPMPITPTAVEAISSIDGAVIVDQSGVCYAFGVILDGIATQRGDPGRGARFNSAVRYLESQQCACIACVVSEDGDVTLLPRLRPRVNKKDVALAIEALRTSSEESPIRPRVYAAALQHVDGLRFYLSERQCTELNEIVDRVEKAFDEDGRQVKVIRSAFRAHPEMNERYFFPEQQAGG